MIYPLLQSIEWSKLFTSSLSSWIKICSRKNRSFGMVNRCDLILNVTYTIEIWSILIYGCFVTNSIVFTSQCSGLNSRAFNPFWQATNTSSQVNYNDHANGLSRFFPLFVYKMNYHTKINDYYRFFLSLLFWNESHENLLLLERRKKIDSP